MYWQQSSLIRYLKFTAVSVIILAFSATALAQCQECQGRCYYGVDGKCKPKRLTYGHYQSTWRKWPEPPPPVPSFTKPDSSDKSELPESELPEPFDESDLDPDFPYLKTKAPGIGDANQPPVPPMGEMPEVIFEPLPGDAPLEPGMELPETTSEGPALEGPVEGSSTRFVPNFRDGSSSPAVQAYYDPNSHRYDDRRQPSPSANPLRSRPGPMHRASFSRASRSTVEHSGLPQMHSNHPSTATRPARMQTPRRSSWSRQGSLRRDTRSEINNPLRD